MDPIYGANANGDLTQVRVEPFKALGAIEVALGPKWGQGSSRGVMLDAVNALKLIEQITRHLPAIETGAHAS